MQNFDLYRLDGHALRVLAKVIETGSVSRTADMFDVNQSTISHTLDRLRSALGDPLFVKSGRGILPTDRALQLYPRIQQILAQLEGLVEPEVYDVTRDRRPVVVAIPTPALLDDMRALQAAIHAAAPDTRFEIRRLAPREELEAILTSNAAELAIAVAGERYPPMLGHQPYGQDELAVFYDPQSRSAVKSLDDYLAAPHGVVHFGGATKSVVEKALAERDLVRMISLIAPTASMLGDMIRGTNIVATMPRKLAEGAYHFLAHGPVPLDLPPVNYDLLWHRRHTHSGRNVWLRDLVLKARSQAEPGGIA